MYVADDAPLPQNGSMPRPSWEIQQEYQDLYAVGISVADAASRLQLAPPSAFVCPGVGALSPAVTRQVQQARQLLNIAGPLGSTTQSKALVQQSQAPDRTDAPVVVPLNPVDLNPPVSCMEANARPAFEPPWADSTAFDRLCPRGMPSGPGIMDSLRNNGLLIALAVAGGFALSSALETRRRRR